MEGITLIHMIDGERQFCLVLSKVSLDRYACRHIVMDYGSAKRSWPGFQMAYQYVSLEA